MSIVNQLKVGIQERRQQEDLAASVAKLQANQDYIAMMTDIELEEDEETEESEAE